MKYRWSNLHSNNSLLKLFRLPTSPLPMFLQPAPVRPLLLPISSFSQHLKGQTGSVRPGKGQIHSALQVHSAYLTYSLWRPDRLLNFTRFNPLQPREFCLPRALHHYDKISCLIELTLLSWIRIEFMYNLLYLACSWTEHLFDWDYISLSCSSSK